jgi:hypothetical protein
MNTSNDTRLGPDKARPTNDQLTIGASDVPATEMPTSSDDARRQVGSANEPIPSRPAVVGSGIARIKPRIEFAGLIGNLAASLAVIITGVLVYWEASLIHESVRVAAEDRDRPALLFLQNAEAQLVGGAPNSIVRLKLQLRNQGSGNAYSVNWKVEDQIPPLHSHLLTKRDAFRTYANCQEAFRRDISQSIQNMVIGSGQSHVVTIDHVLNSRVGLGEHHIKKYVAAFYESELSRRNAAVIGLSIRISRSGEVTTEVEDVVIVADPRAAA